jgi:hypothetical protein
MRKRPGNTRLSCRSASALLTALAVSTCVAACTDARGIETSAPAATSAPPVAVATTATTTPVLTPGADTERLVQQRYTDFQRVVAESGATSDADDPRLAEYATGAVLENLRGKLAVRQQAGTRLYGAPVPHVSAISVRNDRAIVTDCLDNSKTGLMDKAGNKLSVGRARQETTATLVRVGDSWKVSEITTVAGGGSC